MTSITRKGLSYIQINYFHISWTCQHSKELFTWYPRTEINFALYSRWLNSKGFNIKCQMLSQLWVRHQTILRYKWVSVRRLILMLDKLRHIYDVWLWQPLTGYKQPNVTSSSSHDIYQSKTKKISARADDVSQLKFRIQCNLT